MEMVGEIILGALIGSIGATAGAGLGVLGQIIGNNLNHKKEIERIRIEFILKEKIEAFKRIYEITCKLKKKLPDFIIPPQKEEAKKRELMDLIFQLNNESFLFLNKETLKGIREGIDFIQRLIDNPPNVLLIKDNLFYQNENEIKNLVNLISNAQIKIISSIRKELKI
jgi:hypothetical protein